MTISTNSSIALSLAVALALEAFGADYIELTNPLASPAHRDSCRAIAAAVRKSKVLAHIRCRMQDAAAALDTGVDGLNLFIGASSILRGASFLGSLNDVIARAESTIAFIKVRAPHLELRLSMEDAFRAPLSDLLHMTRRLDSMGMLNRIGIADTTGIADPMRVHEVVSAIRRATTLALEFHAHNDTGCATANSFAAFEAGAEYIDTSVLGLGERNGITPLAELVARIYVSFPDAFGRYDMRRLGALHRAVARAFMTEVPVNHPIVGARAFTHRAGVHINALLSNPLSYQAIEPEDFGCEREMDFNSPIAGRHGRGGFAVN